MKASVYLVCLVVLILAVSSIAAAEDVTYRKQIKPVFDSKCLACHGADSAPEYYAFKEDPAKWTAKGQGMRMDTYSHLVFYTAWPDTGALMRRLDDGKVAGKQGNMYVYLGASEEERQKNLALFKNWVGNWTPKRWKDITKEDMDKIKVKY